MDGGQRVRTLPQQPRAAIVRIGTVESADDPRVVRFALDHLADQEWLAEHPDRVAPARKREAGTPSAAAAAWARV